MVGAMLPTLRIDKQSPQTITARSARAVDSPRTVDQADNGDRTPMMNRTAKRNVSCPVETLEERQLFSATMGTINVTDMGTHPGVVVTY